MANAAAAVPERAASTKAATSTSEGSDNDDQSRHRSDQRRRRAVPSSRLVAANVYVSEGRDRAVIDRLVASVGGWRGRARGEAESDVNAFDFESFRKKTSTSCSSPSSNLGAALVHVFVDEPYNRTGFTLAGLSSCELEGEHSDRSSPSSLSSVPAAVDALAKEALALIDWRAATGTHPAIGVVDHVAVHPLFPRRRWKEEEDRGGQVEGPAVDGDGGDGDDEASRVAKRVAATLGQLGVPTYLYGTAKMKGRSEWTKLSEVRRSLNYFGGGTGEVEDSRSSSSFERFPVPLPPPDSGPATADPAKGAAAVGSVPWVMNVNVPLSFDERGGDGVGKDDEGENVSPRSSLLEASASSVARAVSARRGTPVSRGGFAHPGVEALALPHAPGIVEVACNLTDGSVGPLEVAMAVEAAAKKEGLAVVVAPKENDDGRSGNWYVTGKSAREVADEAAEALGLEIVLRAE